jgi:hypothetical protein
MSSNKTWDKVVGYIGLVSGIFSIISFAFPEIPDVVRYVSLAIAGGISAYYVFQMYVPLNVYARAYRANAQSYGYKYEKLDVRAIMGEDGSASVSRTMKVVPTSPELREVHHYLMVPGSREEIKESLSLIAEQISCDDLLRRLIIEKRNGKGGATFGRLRFVVKIEPPLGKRKRVEYELQETAPPGTFVLTKDQLPSGIEHEFFAWEISRPTKELLLEIKIPVRVATENQVFDVWRGTEFGPSTFVPEFERVRSFTKAKVGHHQDSAGWRRRIEITRDRDYVICTLIVPYPTLGMRYVIKWSPADSPATDA